MNNHIIELSDNRHLCYAEYGDHNGFPVVYFHGSQSSRLEMHYDLTFAIDNSIRIITIDRPGHGMSHFNNKGSIMHFANDVIELMDFLKIKKFSVIGMSAGAPFAMGLAYKCADRIYKLGIVSGFAPYIEDTKKALSSDVKILLSLAKSFPFLLKLMLKVQLWQLKRSPHKALKNFLKIMSQSDKEVLKNPKVMDIIHTMFVEAFANGSQGIAYEISNILVKDWNFPIEKIGVPTYIWHGADDTNVPQEWAKYVNSKISNSKLTIYPDEGHLIIFKNAKEIFCSLK